ncbi:helix-turn-helix domain-containing protein, partial [Corynebacterium tapiri]
MRKRLPRNGLTARELAERIGCSSQTIRNWTAEPRADYLARANEKRERVRALRAKGLSMRGIAAEIGCSVGTVHRYVAEQKAEQKT